MEQIHVYFALFGVTKCQRFMFNFQQDKVTASSLGLTFNRIKLQILVKVYGYISNLAAVKYQRISLLK